MNKIRRLVEMLEIKWHKGNIQSEYFHLIENGKKSKYVYFFDEQGLKKDEKGLIVIDTYNAEIVYGLIKGDCQINKLPWSPIEGNLVYIALPSDSDLYIADTFTRNDRECLYLEEQGLLFDTSEKAIEASKKMLEAIRNERR